MANWRACDFLAGREVIEEVVFQPSTAPLLLAVEAPAQPEAERMRFHRMPSQLASWLSLLVWIVSQFGSK